MPADSLQSTTVESWQMGEKHLWQVLDPEPSSLTGPTICLSWFSCCAIAWWSQAFRLNVPFWQWLLCMSGAGSSECHTAASSLRGLALCHFMNILIFGRVVDIKRLAWCESRGIPHHVRCPMSSMPYAAAAGTTCTCSVWAHYASSSHSKARHEWSSIYKSCLRQPNKVQHPGWCLRWWKMFSWLVQLSASLPVWLSISELTLTFIRCADKVARHIKRLA